MKLFLSILFFLIFTSLSMAQAEEVTLKIEGMTWDGCASKLAKALEGLDGTESAQVSFKEGNAVVKYDPKKVTPEKMISTIEATPHMMGEGKYEASLASEKETKEKADKGMEHKEGHGMGGMMDMCMGMMKGGAGMMKGMMGWTWDKMKGVMGGGHH